MGTICLQCGDKGSTNAFVYCVKCLNFAVHRYCLDVIPETLDELVHWVCGDDCEGEANHIVPENVKGTRDHIVPENVEVFSCVGGKESDLLVGPKKSSDACTKVDLVDCGLLPKDERKICQPSFPEQLEAKKGKGNLMRQTRLLKGTTEKSKKRKRSIIKFVINKDEHSLDNATSCKRENKKSVKMACDTKLPSKVKGNKGFEQRDRKRISVKSSKKKKKKIIISSSGNLLENKAPIFGNHHAEEKTGIPCDTKLPCKVKDGEGSEQRDEKQCISLKSSKKKRKRTVISSENKLLKLGNECAEKSTEEKKYSPSKARTGNGELEDGEKRNSGNCNKNNLCEDFPKDLPISSAEPVAMPIWRGSFSIWNKNHGLLNGLLAHVSILACQKVYDEALQFQPVLHLEMLPKSDVWPKSFETSEPHGDNIALYFFPSKSSERDFDCLVDEMMHKELALKAIVQNAELLIFNSSELPLLYWKFQGKYYLWGVFRKKQSTPSNSHPCRMESKDKIRHTDKTSVTTMGHNALSPRSPLSNSASYGSHA